MELTEPSDNQGQVLKLTEGDKARSSAEIYTSARNFAATWCQSRLEERVGYLRKLRLEIMSKRNEIAEIIHRATGKPVVEALATEVLVVLESIRHLERHTRSILARQPVKTPLTLFGKKSYIEYKPRGVVLVISPWNFPFQLSVVPVIEALAAGNCVILKPSEVTTEVGDMMQALFREAGIPVGLIQVVQGDKTVGAELVAGRPDFIHFTGSVAVGRQIQMSAAKHLIPTTLELGGKDPMIVFDDANLERSVAGALWGGYANSGQVCMSVERVYVQRKVYSRFVEMLAEQAAKLTQGLGENDDIGRMTTAVQVATVKHHVLDALERGGELIYGKHPATWVEGDLMIAPMALANVHQEMMLLQEETFGPILPIIPFDTDEEAIALANDSRFGLNSSVWTANLNRGRKVVSQLLTGNASINDVIVSVANPYLPYGGVKDGGIGRYHGGEGLRAFSVQTSVVIDSGRKAREVNWYPYEGKLLPFSSLVSHWYGRRRNLVKFLKAYLQLMKK